MKNKLDQRREYWGRVHDMVDAYNEKNGTDVRTWQCVRTCGLPIGQSHPSDFVLTKMADLEFAVAILDGKPVFVGDPVFHKDNQFPVDWFFYESWKDGVVELSKNWTLQPPKKPRTFTLNGVELPCPVEPKKVRDGSEVHELTMSEHNPPFWFLSKQDRNSVRAAIISILSEARDKE